ncbi:MAG: hypothetical protein BWY32_03835 [bacterium ADurb.Bin243]|nr:MAG: hypothetical protein BWY32_03835 [bacterium ADurb.Bin243]
MRIVDPRIFDGLFEDFVSIIIVNAGAGGHYDIVKAGRQIAFYFNIIGKEFQHNVKISMADFRVGIFMIFYGGQFQKF